MDTRTVAIALKPAAWGWAQKAAALRRQHGVPLRRSMVARQALLHLLPAWIDLQAGLVVDLGANVGDWTAGVSHAVPGAKLLGVEPYPPAYRRLQERFAVAAGVTLDPRAVGAEAGESTFHVAAHDVFGSLLHPAPAVRDLYGDESTVIDEITVPVTTLDELLGGRPVSLLKIDVQGAELQVFAGGRKSLVMTQAILVEANLVNLYEGGSTFPTVFEALAEQGFALWDLAEPHRRANGLPVYLDALFVRLPRA